MNQPPNTYPSIALKEWDAQVQALRTGTTALLIRKGGISEINGGFEITHQRFWLYPTFLHQNSGELQTEYAPLLRPDLEPGRIHIDTLAEVVGLWKVEDLQQAKALAPYQALNPEAIERRFFYRNKPWLHAILLNIFKTTTSVLQETQAYAGCVSWVQLESPMDNFNQEASLLQPCLASEKLLALQKTINALLT